MVGGRGSPFSGRAECITGDLVTVTSADKHCTLALKGATGAWQRKASQQSVQVALLLSLVNLMSVV